MEVKALACQLPCEREIPFSRLSHADIAREAVVSGIVASISGATVWRWLSADASRLAALRKLEICLIFLRFSRLASRAPQLPKQ